MPENIRGNLFLHYTLLYIDKNADILTNFLSIYPFSYNHSFYLLQQLFMDRASSMSMRKYKHENYWPLKQNGDFA